MSASMLTPQGTHSADSPTTTRDDRLASGRAARELGLKRSEFDVAVGLGRISTVLDEGGGGRCVTRAEIQRVREREGFPESLRDSVRIVGMAEGAALMQVPKSRFTRFARLGLLVPVKVYLNRYRAVVWLYLADELKQFAADENNAGLLLGRTPGHLREQLKDGQDRRPRNWRGRHLGFLLRQTEDPWAQAAAVASLLDPVEIAAVVVDPHERSHLQRLRPAPVIHGSPDSPAAQLAEEIMTAAESDEIRWLRAELARLLHDAREDLPAPRCETHRVPRAVGHHPPTLATDMPTPSTAAQTDTGADTAAPHLTTPDLTASCLTASSLAAPSPIEPSPIAPSPIAPNPIVTSPIVTSPTAPGFHAPSPGVPSTARPPSARRHPAHVPERSPGLRGRLGRLRRRSPGHRPTRPAGSTPTRPTR